jgi:glycerophosphoryl diester phosphodiesterase
MVRVRDWMPAVVVGAAASVVACCLLLLGLLRLNPDLVARHTAGVAPQLQYDAAGIEALQTGEAIAIAHNSGNSIATAREAFEHGARAIEIDVAMIGGRLRAAHDTPHRLLGDRFTRRPLLENVWEEVEAAELIVLDLKASSRGFVDGFADFLADRPAAPVVVVSRHPSVLGRLAERIDVPSLLSVPDKDALFDALSLDSVSIDGISIRQQLVDHELMRHAAERDWAVIAWTVDDPLRFEEIDRLGVAAVATGNLAIVEANGATELAVPLTTLLNREVT